MTKVLFMGTPDFAVNSFHALCREFSVVGVLTQPDKPKGRGYTLTPPPIKVEAEKLGISVYQPETLKDFAIKELLEELSPDVIAVVAYGKILPSYVLDYPKYGCVNLHGSILPKYRGAAPMQRAIIDGDKVTGVTTQLMAQGVDTGDILEKAYVEIDENDNFEDIHDRLSLVGAELIVSTIKKLTEGLITPEGQDHSLATHAAKIEKTDCLIDFANDARDVHNLIRGLSPIPLSFAYLNGKMIKIKTSRIVEADGVFGKAGEVLSADSKGITLACGRGKLLITELVPEGKKAMSAASFVNGRGVAVGDILKSVKE